MMKRWIVCGLLLAQGVLAQQSAPSWNGVAARCPILDERVDPVCSLKLTYLFPANSELDQEFSMLELDADAELFYIQDILLGDLDLRLDLSTDFPLNRGGVKLPSQFLLFAMDGRWTWRYVNDMAFQWRFAPGFYSQVEGLSDQSLAMPLTFLGIKTFDPTFSAVAGLSLRFGFRHVVMPMAGVVWMPSDQIRVEALLPTSRAIIYLMPRWAVHAGASWESMTYQLPDDSRDREHVTFEDVRLTVGVIHEISNELRVGVELGRVANRTIAFERGGKIEVDSAPLLSIQVGGAF